MDYKKVENFAFWTVMVGMGVVLSSLPLCHVTIQVKY